MANRTRLSPVQRAISRLVARHGSSRAAAQAIGLDPGYFSRLESGKKTNPGPEVLAALGLERRVIYREKVAESVTAQ